MIEHDPSQRIERLSPSLLVVSFAVAAIFLYLRTFLLPATPFIALGDEIIFLLRAMRIVHGQVLYRDFFELVPPGTELLYAAIFRLLGVHVWIVQGWNIVIGMTFCCVITSIASKLFNGPLILLPALLFLVFDFSNALDLTHHWYSTLAVLVAVNLFMGEIHLKRIFAAGLLCGVATLFTQTQGVLAFCAFVMYVVWLGRGEGKDAGTLKRLAVLTLPFGLILSGVCGYYIYKAGMRTVFFDLVIFPLRYMSSGESNSPRSYLQQFPAIHAPADTIRSIPFLFIYAVVPYIYFFGLYRLWRRRNELSRLLRQHLVLLHLVGLAIFLAVASGPRHFRLSTVAPPAILVCVWLVSQQNMGLRITRNLLWSTAAVFAFLFPIYRQTQWHASLNLPIGRTAFSDKTEFQEFQWLAQRTRPSDRFFNQMGLSFYLSLENPTASEFVNYDEYTRPEQVTALVQSLQNHPPHFVVLSPPSPYFVSAQDHSGPFRQYIHENYHLVRTFYFDYPSRYEEIWEIGSK